MRTPFARVLSLLGVAGMAFFALRTHDARAAWPPAPGADMRDKANWPNDYNGRWSYLSYLPARTSPEPLSAADVKLGAAGMSIDKAWTYTTGRDDVHIAVIDSGIEWDRKDLVNRVALNAVELKGNKRPKTSAGDACGGTGKLAGYDCNGDGIFNVADYRDDPRIAPTVAGEKCFTDGERTQLGPDRIQGDVNRNCILDPGDLIQLFSDGVDDDANGYTDDIAGWDFFKNDNDPYDDTRHRHGSDVAIDSSAEANNGEGDPGVCPGCRFIPLRVGSSFVADSNDFAKAVIYGADQGVKVVQESLATINQTAFSKAAIDYAYSKGAIVVASMGDDSSRHHNAPATSNHVLTVHSIRYNGQNVESATTFAAFDTCSNYGGHLSLSISATSCSGEATGRSAGLAGLVFSMAAKQGLQLSAEEAIQLFKVNADDIDVPESRGEASLFYFSHPGFDQRFGYGRANAARMMQAIQDRLVPPEVDIVSPEWFAPIQADRSNGPIAVLGRVAALRAKAYDIKVQWAPGVEPEEGDYKDLVPPLDNIPGATVTGGTNPLAQIDPREIDTRHVADADSPRGENARTISVRVQAVAHYDNGDVRGEARRVVSITNDKNPALLDKDLLPGFPMNLGASIEASPKLADIDGDGVRDIVAPDSSGKLHVLTMRSGAPIEVQGFPYRTKRIDGLDPQLASEPTIPSYLSGAAYEAGAQPNAGGVDPDLAREALVSAPAISDLDGDGKVEIVFATWSGTLYVINAKGQDLPGWPKRLPLIPSCPLDPSKPTPKTCMDPAHDHARGTYGSPVIVDMNKDGRPEIVLGAFDGNIYVFELDGTVLPGFPVALVAKTTASPGPSRIMSTPTVADLNGDGIPEIISGSNQQVGGGGAGQVFAVDGRGNAAPGGPYLPNWPFTVSSLKLLPVIAEGIASSQAVADFDGDGRPDVLVQGNGARPLVVKADPGLQVQSEDPPNRLPSRADSQGVKIDGFDATTVFGPQTKAKAGSTLPLFSQPSIGDMDQDGVPDVILSGGSLPLAGGGERSDPGQQLLGFWSGKTGAMLPGSPVVIEDSTFLVNHTIADVSGDDYPEAITGSGGYFLHAADACGCEAPGFPKFTNGWIAASAAVGDVDGDARRSLEVVTGTRDGWLFAWHTRGTSTGPIEWESFHHDNANTGNHATKLDQGRRQRASTPIDCTNACTDAVLPAPQQLDAGGCGCTTAPAPPGRGAIAGGLLGLSLFLARRLARRRCPPRDLACLPGERVWI